MSLYTVYVSPATQKDLKKLPARFRGRIKRAIDTFADDPRPSNSKVLDFAELRCEPRRLRMESWRIIYGIVENEKAVDVLAVHKRPPYDYEDLETLLEDYAPPDDD